MQDEFKAKSDVISVKEWVINLIIMCIPIVNIVFLILWGFSQKDINETKKNWAKASLILMIIGFILTIFLYAIVAVIGYYFVSKANGQI